MQYRKEIAINRLAVGQSLGDGPDGDQSGGGFDAAPCWKVPIGVGATALMAGR